MLYTKSKTYSVPIQGRFSTNGKRLSCPDIDTCPINMLFHDPHGKVERRINPKSTCDINIWATADFQEALE
jgi:hypothetical protein